jgi:putative tryptophan/tyrosine transport system substrate-binding protein
MPALRRLAIIGDSSNRSVRLEVDEVKRTARTLGIEITAFEIGGAEDIAPTFEKLKGTTEALYLTTTPLLTTNRNRLNMLALGARLPTMYANRDAVEVGGLISYGPDIPDLWRRSADYVDKILRGAKPSDLPVEQPTKFDLVINLTTAKALGLTVPPSLIARADEVIE